MSDKNFYYVSFFICLFLAYFFGFRSRQSAGLMNINSILADIGSGSFVGMLFGWVMGIFWTVMLVCAYGGVVYSGYKIYEIYSAGELSPITEKSKISSPNLNSSNTITVPTNNHPSNSNATDNEILKP